MMARLYYPAVCPVLIQSELLDQAAGSPRWLRSLSAGHSVSGKQARMHGQSRRQQSAKQRDGMLASPGRYARPQASIWIRIGAKPAAGIRRRQVAARGLRISWHWIDRNRPVDYGVIWPQLPVWQDPAICERHITACAIGNDRGRYRA
jgi:hypothetical protein